MCCAKFILIIQSCDAGLRCKKGGGIDREEMERVGAEKEQG